MAREAWLDGDYDFRTGGASDSTILLLLLRDSLLESGWSVVATDTFRSPDSDRWVEVAFTKPTTQKLAMVVTDYASRVSAEKRVGTIGSDTYHIHSNRYGFVLSRTNNPGFLMAGIVSHFPNVMTSHQLDVYAGGYHTSADLATSETATRINMVRYDNTFTQDTRGYGREYTSYAAMVRDNGVRVTTPVLLWTEVSGAETGLTGRMFHAVYCRSSLAAGTEITVPIESGVTAKFIVTSVDASPNNLKIAVRKS